MRSPLAALRSDRPGERNRHPRSTMCSIRSLVCRKAGTLRLKGRLLRVFRRRPGFRIQSPTRLHPLPGFLQRAHLTIPIALIILGHVGHAQDLQVDRATCDVNKTDPTVCALGHSLELHVQGLETQAATIGDLSKVVPFINGVALRGATAQYTGEPDMVRFYLLRAGSESGWDTLLREPQIRPSELLPVTIGVEGALPLRTTAKIRLRYYDMPWLFGWIASVFVILALVVGFRSALKVPVALVSLAEGQSLMSSAAGMKYSLSRVQLAYWFVLILCAYLFVSTTTWEMHLIGPGLVGLLGVSGATAFGSAAIDANQARKQRLDAAELVALKKQAESPSPNAISEKRKEELERAAQILKETVDRWMTLKKRSRLHSFFRDILSDETADPGGVEIHRLQNVLWMGFLGFVFVRAVWNTLALPNFDANLVGLMFVSSSTFLGVKQQGNR